MTLDEELERDGIKFIVGKWKPEYVVNGFSNDLARIPANEFKSDDGHDLTAISFEFKEDHTVCVFDWSGNKAAGKWEQTGLCGYKIDLDDFENIPDSDFKDNLKNMDVIEGKLSFNIAFLSIVLEKVEDGYISPVFDPGTAKSSEADLKMNGIVGKYRIAKAYSVVGGKFKLATKEEALKCLKKGDGYEENRREIENSFNTIVEFTLDNQIIEMIPLPQEMPEAEIKKAIKKGFFKDVRDGLAVIGNPKAWKVVDGKYYMDTGADRSFGDEKRSSWDEIIFSDDGYMQYGHGMIMLEKIGE